MRGRIALVAVLACVTAHAATLKPVASVQLPCESHDQMISPAGDQVAVQCKDHSLRLVDVTTGREQHVFASEEHVTSYNYSLDGRWFGVGLRDGRAEVVPASGSAAPQRWQPDTRSIGLIQFLPGDKLVVVAANDRPGQVWDVSGTPELRATLHTDFAGLLACTVSPDGKTLVTANGDTVLRLYDTSTWQMVHEYRGIKLETFAVVFTTDGKYVLAGGPDDHIAMLDLSAGTEIHKLVGEPGVVVDILLLGDSRRAAVLYIDADGLKPPHQVVWNLDTLKAEPLTTEFPPTGGGVVRGKLWLASVEGTKLQLWEYQ